MKKILIAISTNLITITESIKQTVQTILCFLGFHKYISHVSGKFEKCQHCYRINYKD